MGLFDVKPNDRRIYEDELYDFLPEDIIDIHTHIWLESLVTKRTGSYDKRCVTWPALVAKDNSVEDLNETYRRLLPGKRVTPLMFSSVENPADLGRLNAYVSDSARRFDYPALYYSHPQMDGETLEKEIKAGGFIGIKSYLTFAPEYIPEGEVRCYDFFPPHQLEVINRLGMIVMLHIPRHARLRDRVNHAQILEIKEKYPGIRLIIAHVGRAYCDGDVGDAFEALKPAGDLLFDFAANCNQNVFVKLIEAVGPKRILFGTDMPILRMRTRRICENGTYINLIPPGLYGDPSQDSHLREVSAAEAENITFFLYEELLAIKKAAAICGLDREDIKDVFYNNADGVIAAARKVYG